jgi:hypothetical protein
MKTLLVVAAGSFVATLVTYAAIFSDPVQAAGMALRLACWLT